MKIRPYQPSDYPIVKNWMQDLGQFYDEHNTHKPLIDQLVTGINHDANGYFTKEKQIYLAQDQAQTPLAAVCLNLKRGGSCKIGPLITAPHARKKGVSKPLVSYIHTLSQQQGYRKTYASTSHLNTPVINMLQQNGYQLEASYPDQYKVGSNEQVWGKHLVATLPPASTVQANFVSLVLPSKDPVSICQWTQANPEVLATISQIYSQWHNDIGLDFQQALAAAVNRGRETQEFYQSKAKIILEAKTSSTHMHTGLGVFSPKRGRSVKLYPFYGSVQAQAQILQTAFTHTQLCQYRKFYTFCSPLDTAQTQILNKLGFQHRGTLQSPYKPGYDLATYDIFL